MGIRIYLWKHYIVQCMHFLQKCKHYKLEYMIILPVCMKLWRWYMHYFSIEFINYFYLQGDSGGPLVCSPGPDSDDWKLIGVTSFGEGHCRTEFPSVYTRISHFRKWIAKVSGVWVGAFSPELQGVFHSFVWITCNKMSLSSQLLQNPVYE